MTMQVLGVTGHGGRLSGVGEKFIYKGLLTLTPVNCYC